MSNKPQKRDAIGDALHAVGVGATENTMLTQPPKPAETEKKEASAPVIPVKAEAPARTGRKLPLSRMTLQGYLHNQFDVTVERGTTPEDIMATDFWVHIASQLKPLDTMHVISEDGAWYARLLVLSCDRLWAKMFRLEFHDLTRSYANMPKTQWEEFDVKWTTLGKYAVVKKNMPGELPFKDQFNTPLEAYQWLDGHIKTINK